MSKLRASMRSKKLATAVFFNCCNSATAYSTDPKVTNIIAGTTGAYPPRKQAIDYINGGLTGIFYRVTGTSWSPSDSTGKTGISGLEDVIAASNWQANSTTPRGLEISGLKANQTYTITLHAYRGGGQVSGAWLGVYNVNGYVDPGTLVYPEIDAGDAVAPISFVVNSTAAGIILVQVNKKSGTQTGSALSAIKLEIV